MTADANGTARLFLALWPGPVSRNAAAAVQRSIEWPDGARIAPVAGLHVTLHFIGAVPVDQVEPLGAALTAPAGSIQLQLQNLEVWHGGIAVLTPTRVPQALVDLQGELGRQLQREGIALEDRPVYRPHVTLARRAQVKPDRLARPITWRSSGYVLVLSSGPTYTPLRRYGAKSPA